MKKNKISVSNPDELNKHLQHTSPFTWISLGLVAAALLGFFAWSFIYKIKVKISGTATVFNGEASLTVRDSDIGKLAANQLVTINDKESLLTFSDNKPVAHFDGLENGEYTFTIVFEKRPVDFLLGK